MADWRNRLRGVVAGWGLSPEHQAGVVEELEMHLEQQLLELAPRIGEAAAIERVLAQIDDPALRAANVRPRHQAAPSVEASRRAGRGWTGLARDVRYGWRSLGRSPGTSLLAMIALALGIGLTTVMFSIIYGTLMRGLPYDDGNRITVVERSAAADGMEETLPMHEFFAFRDAQRSFEDFGAYLPSTVNLSGDDRPERVAATRVTAGAMAVPHVRPLLGRMVQRSDEDPAGALVVVLSYGVWRDRYAADSGVVGRALRINGLPATIVGVMPDGFDFPVASKLWIPLRLNATAPWGTGASVNGTGRLRRGVTLDGANAELATIAMRVDAEHRRANYAVRAVAQPFVRALLRSQVFTLLYAMFAAVALVFLVACTNVANLLLARAARRTKEIAVRRALGASSVEIARQFLVEAFVLSVLAAVVGAVVAQAGIVVFRIATAGQFPFFADIRLHPQVFAFIALAACVASLVAGALPALTAARSQVASVLKDQSLGSSSRWNARLSRSLVVLELTLSSALLIVGALTTKSLLNLRSVEPRFRTRQVLTARVTLTSRDTLRNAVFFERLSDAIEGLPGVAQAALMTGVPGTGWGRRSAVVEGRVLEREAPRPTVSHLAVTPGFFAAFDIAVTRGRAITSEDRRGSPPVAVVSQRFVSDYFGGVDPIGRRVNIGESDSLPRWVTIVGVVPTLYAVSMQDPWPAEILTAFHQEVDASATIAIRTTGDPSLLAKPLRDMVASMDRDLPVYSVASMQDLMKESTWPSRIFGGLFAVFGIVALVLASIGLYAVLAFAVRQRERELGIRMALGAAAADIVRLVFRDGVAQLAIGVPLGLVLGIGAAGMARATLFGVQPTDPVAVGVVVAVLGATGCAACVAPALRATRVDPLRSIRAE
jgi:putative ABC transport system permease protein